MLDDDAVESIQRRLRHDLRSPLAVIVGRCDMLLQGTFGPLNADQSRSLAAVLRNAERLQHEIQQLAEDLDRSIK